MTADQGKPIAALPSALDQCDRLKARLGARPSLFLDFDGTLTPIVARPEAAVLSASARETVAALASRMPVAVVSGRDRADVAARVGLPGLIYAGSHGFDISVPGRSDLGQPIADDFTPALDRAEALLRRRLDGVAGALVERKRFTIAAHWRNVSQAEAHRVADAVSEAVAEQPQLKAKPGKKVFELQPAVDWHKGRAVLWLVERLGLGDTVPMFVGDDTTDEDAFRTLKGRGVGIVVADAAGDRCSQADFRLPDVDAVVALLRRL